MKRFPLLLLLLALLLSGCGEREIPAAMGEATSTTSAERLLTLTPTRRDVSTPQPSEPTITTTPTKTATPAATPTVTITPLPTYPPETRVRMQCLDIASGLPNGQLSSGIVVFDNGSLLDISTSQILSMSDSILFNAIVSSDKTLIAFEHVILNDQHRIASDELVVATADGLWLKTISWEEDWLGLLQWTEDQRLLLAYDKPIATADGYPAQVSYLVLDPFTGERQVIYPDYPQFLDLKSAPGWWGVVYDPLLTRAVYGWRYMQGDEEMYTLALWDMEKQQLITTLEDFYPYYVVFKEETPLPRWSLDGAFLAFRGQFVTSLTDERATFELYRVSPEGEVEQLTYLGLSTNRIPSRMFDWSPDGRYIAMYLEDWSWEHPYKRVALLDTETLQVTDYCIPVGKQQLYQPPIWSPDSTQFLVVDRHEENHRRVILVDIVQGFAAVIAEDMEPVGWMLSPDE